MSDAPLPPDDLDTDAIALLAYRLKVCPACGCELTSPGYGSGRIADGVFCSFRCFGRIPLPPDRRRKL